MNEGYEYEDEDEAHHGVFESLLWLNIIRIGHYFILNRWQSGFWKQIYCSNDQSCGDNLI